MTSIHQFSQDRARSELMVASPEEALLVLPANRLRPRPHALPSVLRFATKPAMGKEAGKPANPAVSDPGDDSLRRDVRFPDTRWSLISGARATDDGARERALSELCRLYWYPVYAFARSRGCGPHQAEDLTQDLFLKFLSNDSFRRAAKEKGKLRTYLLTAMTNVMANDARRSNAAKRAPEKFAVPIERDGAEVRLAREGPWTKAVTPDQQFDRRWAEAVLRQVERRIEIEQEEAGKGELFEALKRFLVGAGGAAGYGGVAAALGMSEGAVKVAVHRLRKRFKLVLRDEIAQTVADPDEVDEELRHLYAALAGGV